MISFGPADGRTEGEIYTAFGKWLDLYNEFPHKVLSYASPYDVIEQMVNPTAIVSVGQLIKQYVFRPTDAVREMRQKKTEKHRTPKSCGNRVGTNRKPHPKKIPGERYNAHALRTACRRACVRAKVAPFTPYDLRRSAATYARSVLGKEAKLLATKV